MSVRHTVRRIAPPAAISSLLLLASSAQPPQPPTLASILQSLETNRQTYQTTVPSFFCNEHLVSKVHQSSSETTQPAAALSTVADSVFRVARTENPTQPSTLSESREVIQINGQPPHGRKVAGPSILTGAFTGALSIVSLTQQSCLQFTLRPVHPGSRTPYEIKFATLPARERPAHCPFDGDATGRALIDPAAVEITHIEISLPHQGIFPQAPDGSYLSAVWGSWHISIDYAPVQLNGRTYWMPSLITATTKTETTNWAFRATYTNYHKFEVTSRILP
jgi:hypothetical protein